MLKYVRQGDEVFVHSMDRLACNLANLLHLVTDQTGRGIKVNYQKENLTFTGEDSAVATLMLSIIGAVAAVERSMILERQREGIALARVRGAYKGRKPALTDSRKAEVRPCPSFWREPRDNLPMPARTALNQIQPFWRGFRVNVNLGQPDGPGMHCIEIGHMC